MKHFPDGSRTYWDSDTADKADELTKRLVAGEPVAALAREYGVSRQTVYNVRDRATV